MQRAYGKPTKKLLIKKSFIKTISGTLSCTEDTNLRLFTTQIQEVIASKETF